MASKRKAHRLTRTLKLEFFQSSAQSPHVDVTKGPTVQLVTSLEPARCPNLQQDFVQCDC